MKELSIEQKAKRYDEVVNEIKKLRDNLLKEGVINENGIIYDNFNRIFPELNESDDEKIRKAAIAFVEANDHFGYHLGISKENVLAWLEKQGVSKSHWKPTEEQYEALVYAYNSCSDTERGNYYEGVLETLIEDLHRLDEQDPKFRVGDTIKKKSTGDIVTISVVDLKNREYKLSNAGFIPFKYEYLWELIEQKPTDKIEPKFKVGDWVIGRATENKPRQIAEVLKEGYKTTYGGWIGFSFEKDMHLWTIEDAKDGDVLATENFIFIFKSIDNANGVHYYCHYEIGRHEDDIQFGIALPQSLMGRVGGFTHYSPATKEQRDLLFGRMKEAGYEWDAENKRYLIVVKS